MADERHKNCIPAYAVYTPVTMPSTSNYQRDMAIGVDKSEFLKIVYGKEEDTRFKTLIGLKRPAVLQRAGATTARQLYDKHLKTSRSTGSLRRSGGSSSRLGKGHFLASEAKGSSAFPSLPSADDPRVKRAKARERRKKQQREYERATARAERRRLRRAGAATSGSVASGSTWASRGSGLSAVSAYSGLSNASGVSYRFGGKGKVSSSPFIASSFPSIAEQAEEDVPEYSEEMLASFGVRQGEEEEQAETEAQSKDRMRRTAKLEKDEDEEAKREISALQERREVLARELLEVEGTLREERGQLEEEQKRRDKLGVVASSAAAVAAAASRELKEEQLDVPVEELDFGIDESNFKNAMVPPFMGQRYEPGLQSTAKAAVELPFVAPETSRIVAGRWRKRNENLEEAQFGYYSPPGETPFYLKGLGSREEMHRHIQKHHLMHLLSQPHSNVYPLFSKK